MSKLVEVLFVLVRGGRHAGPTRVELVISGGAICPSPWGKACRTYSGGACDLKKLFITLMAQKCVVSRSIL